jgi:hypothetical protein
MTVLALQVDTNSYMFISQTESRWWRIRMRVEPSQAKSVVGAGTSTIDILKSTVALDVHLHWTMWTTRDDQILRNVKK